MRGIPSTPLTLPWLTLFALALLASLHAGVEQKRKSTW